MLSLGLGCFGLSYFGLGYFGLGYLGLGCFGQGIELPANEKELLAETSHTLTLESLDSLGPHRALIQATRSDAIGEQSEGLELIWGGWDSFQATWARNGKPTRRTLVLGGQAWVGKLDSMKQWPDTSLYIGELGSSWDAYTRVLAPFAERFVLDYRETVEHEGRTAWVYQVSLAPGTDPKRGLAPKDLSGTVTLDKATAVRLKAEIQGRLWDPQLDCERLVTVNISRSEIGVPPDLAEPAPSAQR
ncbi:MAG: hypothetical protein ACI9VR_000571 [Cognaticolwellia sp.]|jgi:hypothetical protein